MLGSWSGPELVGHAQLLIRDEEQQPKQLRLDRGHGAQDVADRQRVRRGQHGVRGDRVAASPPRASRPGATGRRDPPVQDLAQDALLDARLAADLLEGLVAAERIGDVADRRHDRVDEADAARRAS